MGSLTGRDFLTGAEFTQDELYQVLAKAIEFKRQSAREAKQPLAGKSIAMLFDKPSSRTRVSFEVAIWQLGGHPIFLKDDEVKLGEREPIEDMSRILSRYVDAIVIRTFAHQNVERLAQFATVPVVNALTDDYHPCQTLADLMTVLERRDRLSGIKVAFLGDGNNVVNSLMLAAGILGVDVAVASPKGYEPDPEVVSTARSLIRRVGQELRVTNDPGEAATDADVLYTDVWASMGQEAKRKERIPIFKPYQLNASVLAKAKKDAVVLHCLPAHRGEEITAEVLEGLRSAVFDQAENRLHTAKALLALCVG